jgi:hypothetical protein
VLDELFEDELLEDELLVELVVLIMHSGIVAQSAQTQPSLTMAQMPSFVQFAGFVQYSNATQSGHVHASAPLHVPLSSQGTHFAVAWQSAHAHVSFIEHVPSRAPPSQTVMLSVHFGFAAQSLQLQPSVKD